MSTDAGPPQRLRSTALVDALTGPTGVVVVGASADPSKPSGRSLDYLRRYGFGGDVWVVNPRHQTLAGYPCIASVDDVPAGRVGAAIVNLPAGKVTEALRGLDRVGVRSAVVIGSGFEDPGSAPRQDLQRFLATPERALRVVGPNCVGTMSVASGAHLNFSSVLQSTAPRVGGVALVTQSGATGNGLLMSLLQRGVGIAHWFSTGDELDVGALEMIAGLLPRPDVTAIGLFLEAITDIAWLPQVRAVMADTDKQVFVVKIADSDLGQLAAGGHTGRVVGSSDVSRTVLGQAGFVRVESVAELTDCLVATEIIGRLPGPAGVLGVSVSGASGVILADQVRASASLRMPMLTAGVSADVRAIVRDRVPVANPLDIPFLDETETFAAVLATLSSRGEADVVVAVESSLAHDRPVLADVLCARPDTASPVFLSHLSEDDRIESDLVAKLADARVAVFPTPERAVRALDYIVRTGSAAARPTAGSTTNAPHGRLLGLDAVAALLPSDFPWARWETVRDPSQARTVAERFCMPVAIKAAGRTIVHRSELGAIEIVRDGADIPAAYERVAAICERYDDNVIVQQGVPSGQEVLLAVIRDPEYGLAALLRPGGILAELLDEQVVLWHGWSPEDRLEALTGSRIGTLLEGYRGQPQADLNSLHNLVETVLRSLDDRDIAFVEFNPIVVSSGGVHAIDAIASSSENGEAHEH